MAAARKILVKIKQPEGNSPPAQGEPKHQPMPKISGVLFNTQSLEAADNAAKTQQLLGMQLNDFHKHFEKSEFSSPTTEAALSDLAVITNDILFNKMKFSALCELVSRHRNNKQLIDRVFAQACDTKQEPDAKKRREKIILLNNTLNHPPAEDKFNKAEQKTDIRLLYVKKLAKSAYDDRAADKRDYNRTFLGFNVGYARSVELAALHAFSLMLNNNPITYEAWQSLHADHKDILKNSSVLTEFNALLKSEICATDAKVQEKIQVTGLTIG